MSGSHVTQLDAARRAELVALLEERSALLAPPADVVDRALARCIRHDLRTQGREEALAAERASALAGLASNTPTTVTPSAGGSDAPSSALSGGTPGSDIGSEAEAPTVTPSGSRSASAITAEESAQTMPDSAVQQKPLALGELIPPGTIVAGYRIEGLLGKGGMGQVYRAVQLSVQREVAFKVLSPKLASDPGFRERFLREARAAGRLHHVNLIAVHDVGEASGLMFFSMELIEGRTVKELMTAGPMPLDAALDIIAQTLSALKYAHEKGVIHRDIKPDNLMVASGGAVKVADLGLSRIESLGDTSHESGSTQAGSIMGTPHYMAPEQGRDAHAADHRSDLYSVGSTLYHMLCGRPPFTGASAVEVVLKAATAPLTFPEPGPPAAVRGFIARLMAKKPTDRPASAADALALLDRVRGGGSITSDPSKRMRRYIQRKRSFRKLLPLGGAAAVVVAVVIAALALHRGPVDDALSRDLPRIDALAQDSKYPEALALLQADIEQLAKGSRRATEAEDLRQSLESRWDAWAEGLALPSLEQFDAALKAKRYGDAWNALKTAPDSQASPKVRQQIDDRHAAYDRVMEEASSQALEPARADDFRKAAEAWRRFTDLKFAAVLWKSLRATPTTALEMRENVVAFSATGSAQMTLPALEMRRRQDAELRTIEFRLRPGLLQKGERWELLIANARISLADDGLRLAQERKPAETIAPAAPETVLRLRRTADAFHLKVGDGPWRPLAGGVADNRWQFSWSLNPGRAVEVAAHPVFEPRGAAPTR